MTRYAAIGLLGLAAVLGCGRTTTTTTTTPPSPPKGGVHIETPGTKVDVERKDAAGKGGVKVTAPGVDIDVGSKTPGKKGLNVDVDVKR